MNTPSPWLPRWISNAWAPNPLLRREDRCEALLMIAALIVVALLTPLTCALGTAAHDSVRSRDAAVTAQLQQVDATVVAPSTAVALPNGFWFSAPARWSTAAGERYGTVATGRAVQTGDQVQIWVDRDGRYTDAPPAKGQAGAVGVLTALLAWLSVVGGTYLVALGVRSRLDHARARGWDDDLRALTGGGGRTAQGR